MAKLRDMNEDDLFDHIVATRGIRAIQFKEELIPAMMLIRRHVPNPKILLEIGTAEGGAIILLSKMLGDDGLVISIDPNIGRLNESFVLDALAPVKFVQIPHRSERLDAITKLEKILDGRKVDVLYIDGGHRYRQAKYDYETYSLYVNSPGVVVFHDIAMYIWNDDEPMVGLYWTEIIKKKGHYAELRYDLSRPGFGTGIRFL